MWIQESFSNTQCSQKSVLGCSAPLQTFPCLIQLVGEAELSCAWDYWSRTEEQNNLGLKWPTGGRLIQPLVQAGLTSKPEQLCRAWSGQVTKIPGRRLHSLGISSCVWHTISSWNFLLVVQACESGCLACRMSLPSWYAILLAFLFGNISWEGILLAAQEMCHERYFGKLLNMHFPTPDLSFPCFVDVFI